ncbi:hypothetical protein E0I74_29270 [Rhizobium laguerreae]|uniref:hypothetical protein n=1 Tax=Rhizobium laguerreae TaxID=1076926 RepID=UPI00103D4E93|nr:hypothetical protein [Rhizobium laguerreae]MBY3256700.1 hypothetical protein [Rhizobium laguerreae]MBY3281884.1 hypothetical protein [Rhizobium laguerreae]MBY3291588.1 hypothetical protein [Rhizobium laguerreae]MBY3313356.1 hypothetical protein [Rhizobium laguerreae]MBY3322762.1 hypothetical protein [Rhizobium laguerreae]
MTTLFGYIFTWDGFGKGEGTDKYSDLFSEALMKMSQFKTSRGKSRMTSKRWQALTYESRQPLLGEDPGFVESVWTYPIRLRVNDTTGTIVIAAPRYAITDAAVQTINSRLAPNVRRKLVNVGEVSDHLLQPAPQQFAITYYMADVPGYGSALNTISLHGDDIAAADFLVKERASFTARQIGVRPLSQRAECGRFGNTGSIQFRDEYIEMLEQFLAYTYSNGFYID